ncbi:MAG: HetP family heterocyst commitment protein [Nostoc sp. TH1S01]|nr:HetP family heterocyst commitment protein [Nostoc sp. TH1S01]
MNYQMPSSQKNFHSLITPEQLDQVIEAISDGRYSWACVLILRFVGYNPIHFMPQRTYSRLIKEQKQFIAEKLDSKTTMSSSINDAVKQEQPHSFARTKSLDKSDTKAGNIQDINVVYLKSNLSKMYPSKVKDIQN